MPGGGASHGCGRLARFLHVWTGELVVSWPGTPLARIKELTHEPRASPHRVVPGGSQLLARATRGGGTVPGPPRHAGRLGAELHSPHAAFLPPGIRMGLQPQLVLWHPPAARVHRLLP